jgi:NADH:ubiquinone oxidoreductase subunit D
LLWGISFFDGAHDRGLLYIRSNLTIGVGKKHASNNGVVSVAFEFEGGAQSMDVNLSQTYLHYGLQTHAHYENDA